MTVYKELGTYLDLAPASLCRHMLMIGSESGSVLKVLPPQCSYLILKHDYMRLPSSTKYSVGRALI